MRSLAVSAALLGLLLCACAHARVDGRSSEGTLHRSAFFVGDDPVAEAYVKGISTDPLDMSFDPKDHIAEADSAPGRRLSQNIQDDLWTIVRRLVSDYCALMAGRNSPGCDGDENVDVDGSTEWWARYYSRFQPLRATTGVTDLVLTRSATNTPTRTSTRAMYCAPNTGTEQQECSLGGRLETQGSVQTTRTNAFSFQSKIGTVFKFKLMGYDTTIENTIDFGYSFSDAEATARVTGDATIATVAVPMLPNDNMCTYIETYMERAQLQGNVDVYVEIDGYVGSRQDQPRYWQYGEAGEHRHRVTLFSELVRRAKQANIARSRQWTIGANGKARLRTTIQMDMNMAVRTYTNPQRWPISDYRCMEAQRNFSFFNLPGTTPTPAPAPRGRMLQQARSPIRTDKPAKTLRDKMNDLMQAYCRLKSGEGCDLDWDCTTEWCRTDFSRLASATVRTGLDPPVMPQSGQVIENKTTAVMLCPARPFRYTCRLEKQAIASTVQTTTRTQGFNVGETSKITSLGGVDGLFAGVQSGITASFSFSYNFQTAVAEATTETSSTSDTISVVMAPNTPDCTVLTNNMQVLNSQGSMMAFATVDGNVATQQRQRTRWPGMDSRPDGHYYRTHNFNTVVRRCLEANLTEAQEWTWDSRNGGRIVIPIEVQIELGTRGYAEAKNYNVNSQQCAQNLVGQASVNRRHCVRVTDYRGLWCSSPGYQFETLDCDGDGKLDHVCADPRTNRRWALLSSEGCQDTGTTVSASVCPGSRVFNPSCARPSGWCGVAGARYSTPDCDGDGRADAACLYQDGRRWVLLSSRGCVDNSNGVAPASSCPAAFSAPTPTPVPAGPCPRPSGWCGVAGAVYSSVDCDGDGRADGACLYQDGRRWVLLSSRGCVDNSDGVAPASSCPAVFIPGSCARPAGWCTVPGARFSSVDCDRDGKLDATCQYPNGRRWVLLSTRACVDETDGAAPSSSCPAVFSSGSGAISAPVIEESP